MEMRDRFRSEMDRVGHTQKSIGASVGISQEAMQKILAGKTKNPRKILALASTLGVNANWLLTGSGDKYPQSVSTGKAVETDTAGTITPQIKLPAISPKLTKWIVDVIEAGKLGRTYQHNEEEQADQLYWLLKLYEEDNNVINLKVETILKMMKARAFETDKE